MTDAQDSFPAPKAPVGPLSGIFVLDLSRVLAGPFATTLLNELGAQVLKVERPETGDDSRAYGPFVDGRSAYFAGVNRGKGSIALALDEEEDREILLRLLRHADVLVENFRPGTLEKYGLGYDQLKDRFPLLIYTSVSGYGQYGPLSKWPAYDLVMQAMGGVIGITGHPGQPPIRVGASVGDITAGIYTAVGVLAALYDRKSTGQGRRVDIAMLDCQVSLMENLIVAYSANGKVPGPLGSRHASIAPFEIYKTQDSYMVIAAGNDSLFRATADALGASRLKDDARFKTNGLRNEHVLDLKRELETILAAHSTDHWLAILNKAGVPVSAINTVDKLIAEPQVKARNMVVPVEDKHIPGLKVAGNPVKLSGFPEQPARPAASELDADRATVLAWLDRDKS
ncbi:MAG: CoA transferase [Alphaproteobacteria bacterium]